MTFHYFRLAKSSSMVRCQIVRVTRLAESISEGLVLDFVKNPDMAQHMCRLMNLG